MLWKSKISYLALITIVMSACCKDEPDSKKIISDIFSDEEYALYLAYVYDSIPSASEKKILCSGVWTNSDYSGGTPSVRKLSPGRDEGVEVFDICVTEDKKTVYVAGCIDYAAVYWENDKEVILPEGRGALGITVDSKGVVYTCGFQKDGYDELAKLWRGTTPVVLKNGARAKKLSICNGKCYVAGYGINPEREDAEEARIWIDEQSYSRLPQDNEDDKNGFFPALANDIASDGENWWCVGQEKNGAANALPKVWINRSNNNLKREGTGSTLNCIKYENGTYYIGGNDGFHAMYWTACQKSKKENRISDYKEYNLSSGATHATVEDIDVLNGIVVCCGYEMSTTGSYIPKLWINGSEYKLGPQLNSYSKVRPRAVTIVKRK